MKGASYDVEAVNRDVNGDGRLDFNLVVLTADCDLADLNGDGLDDLILINTMERSVWSPAGYKTLYGERNIVRLMNQGGGVLGPFGVVADSALVDQTVGSDVSVGDMDGDGDRDLATTLITVTGEMERAALIFNNGSGVFGPPQWFASGGGDDGVGGVALADVDGDGDLDLGLMLYGPEGGDRSDHPTDRWSLLRNNGSGLMAAPRRSNPPEPPCWTWYSPI